VNLEGVTFGVHVELPHDSSFRGVPNVSELIQSTLLRLASV